MSLEGTPGDCLVQTPMLKQGQLAQAAQDYVQLGFKYLLSALLSSRKRDHIFKSIVHKPSGYKILT